MRIGIIAAVPLELKHVVHGWEGVRFTVPHVKGWRRIDGAGDELMAVCGGMGADAVRRAFAAAEHDGELGLVLSIGLAGATQPSLRLGECAVLSEVVDARTGERFTLTDGQRRLRIASTTVVADLREKKRLFETYGAVMVDMEAATVARMAQQRGIPMCCFKAVSDGADAVLPDVTPFVRDGQLRMLPFLGSVAVRPAAWGPLVRLGRSSAVGSKQLAATIEAFLVTKDWARANRTGAFWERR